MATITYKCDVCLRQIEKLENKQGITVFKNCIMTYGCTGSLRKIARNPDNIRETIPPFVSSLKNYEQRNSLDIFQQTIPSNHWVVEHNLNTLPSVVVYEINDNGSYTIVDQMEYRIVLIDNNTVSINFNRTVAGRAHMISRVAKERDYTLVSTFSKSTTVTNNGIFTFAIPKVISKYSFITNTPVNWQDATAYVADAAVIFNDKTYACIVSHTSDVNNAPPNVSFWSELPALPYDLEDAVIRIEVLIQKPNDQAVLCVETLEPVNTGTPWSNWDGILLNKRKSYYIRTKSILDFNTFDNEQLRFTDIPDGTIIKFLRIDFGTGVFQDIQSRELLLLLSNPPYTFLDKIKDKIIDTGEIIESDIDFFVYTNPETSIDSSNVENVYPGIMES